MTDQNQMANLEQENNRLRQEITDEKKHVIFLNDTIAKATQVTGFMYEEPYRSMLGLKIGDNVLIQGVPELKSHLDKTLQELERLRNENAMLRRELFPPESPKKELKYWIITGIDPEGHTFAAAEDTWGALIEVRSCYKKKGYTNISILEQRVLIDQ